MYKTQLDTYSPEGALLSESLNQRKLKIEQRRKRERKQEKIRLDKLNRAILTKRNRLFTDPTQLLSLFRDKKGLYDSTAELHRASIWRLGCFPNAKVMDKWLTDLVKKNKLRRKYFYNKSYKHNLTVYKLHENVTKQTYLEPHSRSKAISNLKKSYVHELGNALEKKVQYCFKQRGFVAFNNRKGDWKKKHRIDVEVFALNKTLRFETKNWATWIDETEVQKFIDILDARKIDPVKEPCFFIGTFLTPNAKKKLKDAHITLIELKKQLLCFSERSLFKFIFLELNLIPESQFATEKYIDFEANVNFVIRRIELIDRNIRAYARFSIPPPNYTNLTYYSMKGARFL